MIQLKGQQILKGQYRVSDQFKNVSGHLALVKGRQYYKHCYFCCLQIRAGQQKIDRHFNGHHQGQEIRLLRYEEDPLECIYENFDDFKRDPSIKLKMKKQDKKRLIGRPWSSNRHDKSQIKDKQPENEFCIANEDDQMQVEVSKKILGKRAQIKPLKFEFKDGGPAKIQKQEIDNKEMLAGQIVEKQGIDSEEQQIVDESQEEQKPIQKKISEKQTQTVNEVQLEPKEQHRLYCENRNLRIQKETWKADYLAESKELVKVKKQLATLQEKHQQELKKAQKIDLDVVRQASKVGSLEKKIQKLEGELDDKDIEVEKLQDQLKESKSCEVKDDAITYYKEEVQKVEKDRDEKLAAQQRKYKLLEKHYEETLDELTGYKETRADVIQENKQQVQKIEEKNSDVDKLKEQISEVQSQLYVQTDRANGYQDNFETIVKALQNHNYGKCECQIKMIPLVTKAQEHVCKLKLGKQPPGQVQKLIKQKKELIETLDEKERRISDLDKRLDQLEQEDSDQVSRLKQELESSRNKLGEAKEEIRQLQMNQANYDNLIKSNKDYRDEDIENCRNLMTIMIQNQVSGAKLDPKIIDQVKDLTPETPNPSCKESEQLPLAQQKTQQSVIQEFKKPFPQVSKNIMRSRKILTPNNFQCCDYYSSLKNKKDEDLIWHVIGDDITDSIMRTRLQKVLRDRQQNLSGQTGKVLELMAGTGRNYRVLLDFFTGIEMLEQSLRFTSLIPEEVKKYECKVQNFKWPQDRYQCIVGVWCLCYLNQEDQSKLINSADQALKDGGHLILFEPVLDDSKEEQPRLQSRTVQQMVVTTDKYYTKLFNDHGYYHIRRHEFGKEGELDEFQIAYVITKHY